MTAWSEKKIFHAMAVLVDRRGRAHSAFDTKHPGARKAWVVDDVIYHGRGTPGEVRVRSRGPETYLDLRTGDVFHRDYHPEKLPRLYDRGPGHSPRFEPGDDPSLYTVEGNARRLRENDERIAANASRDRVYRGYFVLYDSLGKKYEIYREEDGKPGRFEQYATSNDHARRIIDAIHGD